MADQGSTTDGHQKPGQRHRVVVVGAGFAGINAVHAMANGDVDVTLVDRNNFHTFQPLLYQVGTGYLAVEEVGTALRPIFRRQQNVTVKMATLTAVQWQDRVATLADGTGVAFDSLILALGAETNYFGVPGMTEHAWPLYTLSDAAALRMHLLDALEHLARSTPGTIAPMTTVVVGGGPTGVETAGALSSMAQEMVGPNVQLNVVLLEAGTRLLNAFSEQSSARALADLRRRGVDVRLSTTVTSADATGITLDDGERIETGTVVWAAGVKANALAAKLGLRTDPQGRVVVDDELRVPGHDGVYAVGDLAVAAPGRDVVPMLASAAIQTGAHAGRQVLRGLRGEPLAAFSYHDKGIMAVLGRGDAVAELPVRLGVHRTLRFGGRPAWLLWLGVHIVYLIGFRNRLKVLVDWGWSYLTSRGAGAILLQDAEQTHH